MIWEWAGMIGSILMLDLVLSGDNALVLGATVARLPYNQRWYALFFGGAGAIVLRTLFSSIAAFILNVPWLQTVGAIALLIIAVRMLTDRNAGQEDQSEKEGKSSGEVSFRTAALTILVADVTMSLDNVLAVGAAANGDFLPIVFGLIVSITIIMCGSALVAGLMSRFTWLLDVAAVILAWTSATMIHDDLTTLASGSNLHWLLTISQPVLPLHLSWLTLLLASITCSAILVCDLYLRRQNRQTQKKVAQ